MPVAPTKKGNQVTVDGVIALASQYAERAKFARVSDPYANPPDFTEAGARMLCSRKKKALLEQLPPDATEEDRDRAVTQAPAAACLELDWRWAQWEGKVKREAEEEERRRTRHVRRQKAAERDREAVRRGQSLGYRLDHALAEIQTVSTVKASSLERSVTGTKEQGLPVADTTADKARRDAHKLVRQLEEEAESMKRRRIEAEAA